MKDDHEEPYPEGSVRIEPSFAEERRKAADLFAEREVSRLSRRGRVYLLALGSGRWDYRPAPGDVAWGCHETHVEDPYPPDMCRRPTNPHRLSRVYLMHQNLQEAHTRPAVFIPGFDLDALARELSTVEVVTLPGFKDLSRGIECEPHRLFRRHRYFPLDAIRMSLRTLEFRSTVSYMIADAILEGYEEIVTYGVTGRGSGQYWMEERSSIREWLLVALGLGVKVRCPVLHGLQYGFTEPQAPHGLQVGMVIGKGASKAESEGGA